MAKTETDPAGTSGSQFFVVTGEDAGLPPDYALLGKVTKGQDVVDKIGVAEVGPDEKPLAADRHPPDPHHRILSAISAPPAATPPAVSTAASKPGPSTSCAAERVARRRARPPSPSPSRRTPRWRCRAARRGPAAPSRPRWWARAAGRRRPAGRRARAAPARAPARAQPSASPAISATSRAGRSPGHERAP